MAATSAPLTEAVAVAPCAARAVVELKSGAVAVPMEAPREVPRVALAAPVVVAEVQVAMVDLVDPKSLVVLVLQVLEVVLDVQVVQVAVEVVVEERHASLSVEALPDFGGGWESK